MYRTGNWAKSGSVSGQVIDDETGELLSGVSINVKGTKRGVITNEKGQYQISANDTDTLIFNIIGYESIKKKASATETFLSMEMKSKILDEVTIKGDASLRRAVGGLGYCISYTTRNIGKTTEIVVWGNAVQKEEAILVPRLISSLSLKKMPDIPNDEEENDDEELEDTDTIHSNHVKPDPIDEEKWFQENGFQEVTSVQVYNYSGRIFSERFTKLNDGMISVDVRDIPDGAYIVRVIYKNERTSGEVSKVRLLIKR